MKIVSKRVLAEAVKWTGDIESYSAICEMAKGTHIEPVREGVIAVPTAHGVVEAVAPCWIVKSAVDVYPVDEATFDARWQPATELPIDSKEVGT